MKTISVAAVILLAGAITTPNDAQDLAFYPRTPDQSTALANATLYEWVGPGAFAATWRVGNETQSAAHWQPANPEHDYSPITDALEASGQASAAQLADALRQLTQMLAELAAESRGAHNATQDGADAAHADLAARIDAIKPSTGFRPADWVMVVLLAGVLAAQAPKIRRGGRAKPLDDLVILGDEDE